MLDAWSEVLGIGYSHRFTLAEVVEIANETNKVKVNEDTHFYQVWPRLSTALQAVAAGPHGSVDVRKFGFWMRGKKGRIAGERRFVNNAEAKTKRTYWWIEVRDATGAWTRTAAGRWVGATPEQRETLAGDAE